MKKRFPAKIQARVRADPSRGLPEGVVTFTVLNSIETNPKGILLEADVQAVYVSFPARTKPVARSRDFDDGGVVLDFDEDGTLVGVEMIDARSPELLPEFGAFVQEHFVGLDKPTFDPMAVIVPATVINQFWPRVVEAVGVALEMHAAALMGESEKPAQDALESLEGSWDRSPLAFVA